MTNTLSWEITIAKPVVKSYTQVIISLTVGVDGPVLMPPFPELLNILKIAAMECYAPKLYVHNAVLIKVMYSMMAPLKRACDIVLTQLVLISKPAKNK